MGKGLTSSWRTSLKTSLLKLTIISVANYIQIIANYICYRFWKVKVVVVQTSTSESVCRFFFSWSHIAGTFVGLFSKPNQYKCHLNVITVVSVLARKFTYKNIKKYAALRKQKSRINVASVTDVMVKWGISTDISWHTKRRNLLYAISVANPLVIATSWKDMCVPIVITGHISVTSAASVISKQHILITIKYLTMEFKRNSINAVHVKNVLVQVEL